MRCVFAWWCAACLRDVRCWWLRRCICVIIVAVMLYLVVTQQIPFIPCTFGASMKNQIQTQCALRNRSNNSRTTSTPNPLRWPLSYNKWWKLMRQRGGRGRRVARSGPCWALTMVWEVLRTPLLLTLQILIGMLLLHEQYKSYEYNNKQVLWSSSHQQSTRHIRT